MTTQIIVIREGSLAEHALAHRFDFNLWFQQQLHSTPWWLASLIFHALLILMLASLPDMEPPPAPPPIDIIKPVPDVEKPIDRVVDDIPPVPLDPEKYVTKETPLPPTDNPVDNPSENPDIFPNPNTLAGEGVYNTIGIGPGFGNKGNRPPGGLKPTGTLEDSAVLAGLLWLARHQNPDGSWGAKTFQHQCRITRCAGAGDAQFDTGLTGLALLAFTGAGFTTSGTRNIFDGIDFNEVVRRAVKFLIDHQLSDGSFSAVKDSKFMYNQAICAYALADLYGQVKDRPAGLLFREPAERAVKFLLECRNPGQAWRYEPRNGQNDTSVTGWVMMALKTAEHSGISVSAETFAGIRSFYDDVTDPTYGLVGYTEKGSKAVMSHEDVRNIMIQPSLTAIGIMTRIFIDKKASDPLVRLGVSEVLKNLPAWDTSKSGVIDYYYWFYATYCLNQYDGPDGANWKSWNEKMKDVLLKNQCAKKGACSERSESICADGSWEPLDRWSAEGGRVYATAINVLTLEVYYRLEIVRVK
ncbi:MAG: terpene cyclase/mutase family protein [Planctomycetes bacterium]|nr:terpene cyclase/mutase family protein [Planctomycetota bacterium]